MNDVSAFLRGGIAPELVETFTALLRAADDAAAAEMLSDLCDQGVGPEAIMLDLFAPAACVLGEMWCRDEANFLDVTLGLGRIHRLLRRLEMPVEAARPRGAVLLLPVPGEHHVLGLRIVEEFLLRAGWRVHLTVTDEVAGLRRLLAARPYDIIGVSISSERLLPVLRSVISEVRAVSCNPDIRIMVGGAILSGGDVDGPGLGADAIVRDAQAAVEQADVWFSLVGAE